MERVRKREKLKVEEEEKEEEVVVKKGLKQLEDGVMEGSGFGESGGEEEKFNVGGGRY